MKTLAMTKKPARCTLSVSPCSCTKSPASVHGFIDEGGAPWGMYLAERRNRGRVRFLELAISLHTGGTIAVRVFTRGRRIHARIVPPGADDDHPAFILGCWMTPRAAVAEVPDLAGVVRAVLRRDVRLPRWIEVEVEGAAGEEELPLSA